RDTWVYNPVTNTTVQTGLTGGAYTGSAGRQESFNNFQNQAGQVAGYSLRYTGVNTDNGRDAWVYNPFTNTTTQIGFTGTGYTGSAGFQFSFSNFQNEAGQVAGYSVRRTGVDTYRGVDTWVYNPVTNTTTQIGFTGAGYTGSAGFQFSLNNFQNQAGQVAGISNRYTGVSTFIGEDTWVYNPVTNTTVQTGFTGGVYTGSAGFQVSENNFLNEAGQVAGRSVRYTGVNTVNGRDTWVYNPVTNTTVQTGLTGGVYTGSAGFQQSVNNFLNQAGQVAGYSQRRTGVSTFNGEDTWVYNPVTNTTVQTGLTGGVYTGSAGYQSSQNNFQNEAGHVAGRSNRVTGVNTFNGQDTWVYNPVTNTTVQTGLTGGDYTGSAGYQVSVNDFQNQAGQVAGNSRRYTGVSTQIGQDAWYFDPITQNTYQPTLGVPDSIRTSDNFAFSSISILTDDGFALGYYSVFAGGLDPAVDRAFIFRADLGFSDLGDLVDGGLSAAGWDTLLRPEFQTAMQFIVGNGYFDGQTGDSRSVFVMKLIPAPSALALLGLGGLLAAGRRRR
ncbi:MAG: PEP-CTERM sorting domain-containing protein, partial [Phycisphaeraceae bacterium]|nr:PEP-CTERM sorting domain-containing protein [Phycisphaeraceae bacterium]